MKTSETKVIVLAVLATLFLLSTQTSAVLTGYQHRDITDDSKFGCQWLGGSNAGAINCTCREDADEMYIQENSIPTYDTSSIQINDCKTVRFGGKSVADMRNLRNIHLKNIEHLHLEQFSLTWYGHRDKSQYEERYDISVPSLKITIENCNISDIASYTFEGRINTIQFDKVIIENMEAFAFNKLMQTRQISLRNTEIRNTGLSPFKKISTENLELDGVIMREVPSRFLSNVRVYSDFTIRNCNFDAVRSGAFIVHDPAGFRVVETRINHLDGEAFRVTLSRGDVLFKNNKFDVIDDGAFAAITLNREDGVGDGDGDAHTITFESNFFTTLTRGSLDVHADFRPLFSDLSVNETCDCKSIEHKFKDGAFYSDIRCLYDGKFVTVTEYKANMCSIVQSYSTVIVVGGVVLTLCVIVVTVLVVYYRRVHLSKKYGNEKQSKKGNMSLIVPDGRTYRETELHVIVERADLLTTDL